MLSAENFTQDAKIYNIPCWIYQFYLWTCHKHLKSTQLLKHGLVLFSYVIIICPDRQLITVYVDLHYFCIKPHGMVDTPWKYHSFEMAEGKYGRSERFLLWI